MLLEEGFMSITADVHVHTTYSGDAKATMDEMIQKAISLGMKQICFTDHNDFDYPYREHDKPDMFLLNTDAYLFDILRAREKYAGQIKILFGVELGLAPEIKRKNLILAKSHEFDFIIGSSHLCHGRDPYYADFYENRDEKSAYREYFESILENVKGFTQFDVYGHLDYVVRYGPTKNANYKYEDHADVIDEILRILIENEKGIEINTGGFRCDIGTTNPCREIVKRYKELGGEIITVGSDAHSTEYLQDHFEDAAQMLKDIGFKYYCVFENRIPEFIKL